MKTDELKLVQVKIGDLKPAEYNPRKWSEKAVEQLKESLTDFGQVDPIIVNSAPKRENIVIGGHFRLEAAKQLGWERVKVLYVEVPELEREKELNLRLNKNTGEFDYKLLAGFTKEMLSKTGFDSNDLDRIFEVAVAEDDFDAEKEYDKIKKPEAKAGDIYQLGVHRLMCGDSTKPEDFKKLMQGNLGRLIFTDPPYNVDYKSASGMSYNSKKFGGTGGKIFNDNKSDGDCLTFYTDVLKNLYENTTKDVTLYWWFANNNNVVNREAWRLAGWFMSQIIIWLKNGMVLSMGQLYHRMYEPCMVGWKAKGKHYVNKKLATYKDVVHLDVTDFSELLDVWYEKRDALQNYVHPTQKPVRLTERAIKKSSERGDIVLDVFGGGGRH